MDNPVHHLLEVVMDELKYELLAEVYGRMEAELIKSYLEAHENRCGVVSGIHRAEYLSHHR